MQDMRRQRVPRTLLAAIVLAAVTIRCASQRPAHSPATGTAPGAEAKGAGSEAAGAAPGILTARSIPLPGGGADGVFMDYLACDRAEGAVWVPAGNSGSVDVIRTATGRLERVSGFPTAEIERRGQKRTVGPSSASVSESRIWVGNRANSNVCAIDKRKLTIGPCIALATSPDGVAWVAATKEVWVTTPRDQTITILDVSRPDSVVIASKIKLDGDPEGYAVDERRGLFYTNLEDKDLTLAIDIRSHAIKATWNPGCGEEGPRGLAVDPKSDFLFVACTDHVEVLDAAHGGAILSRLDTGAGVDNIDYLPARRELFVAAGRAARLTEAHVDEAGHLTAIATGQTADGTRVVVADADGVAYVADSKGGRILAFP
jgi:DNA-binding beta-propeller fold protein YncE